MLKGYKNLKVLHDEPDDKSKGDFQCSHKEKQEYLLEDPSGKFMSKYMNLDNSTAYINPNITRTFPTELVNNRQANTVIQSERFTNQSSQAQGCTETEVTKEKATEGPNIMVIPAGLQT